MGGEQHDADAAVGLWRGRNQRRALHGRGNGAGDLHLCQCGRGIPSIGAAAIAAGPGSVHSFRRWRWLMQHIRRLTGLALAVGLGACTDSPASLPTASGVELRALGAKPAGAVTAGVAPRASRPYGRTYEAWGGAMLQWLAAIPTASNPYIDETGALTQAHESGRVWFLPGPSLFVTQPQELALTMPAGKAIFFAPFGGYGSGPGGVTGNGDDTPEELRDSA